MKNVLIIFLILSCLKGAAQPAGRFEVLIDEIMPDPLPAVGLPATEFIELRNQSARPFNLRNWKITDGSSTAVITSNYTLLADSFVVICAASASPLFAQVCPAIGVANFPALNNDEDVVTLVSPEGRTIHSVAYSADWYSNAVKQDGGWTLEMKDPDNPCGGMENWAASIHPSGGTPGSRNSVHSINRDTKAPEVVRSYTIDSVSVVVLFNEPVDSIASGNPIYYSFGTGRTVQRAYPLPPDFTKIRLEIEPPLPEMDVCELTVRAIRDCSGNIIGAANRTKVGKPSVPRLNDVIINEILFNPVSESTDYAEIYNRSKKIIDLSQLYVAEKNNSGGLAAPARVTTTAYLMFPGDHIVLTDDREMVMRKYLVPVPQNLLKADLPSLPDDKGSLAVLNGSGEKIDELQYDEKWHFPMLSNREGVALERLSPEAATQNSFNWTSSSSIAGYGTPTYKNSQNFGAAPSANPISISTLVFSPDNDGRDDHCLIQYDVGPGNKHMSITVVDIAGRVVKRFPGGMSIAGAGLIRWDGIDDLGRQLPAGIYIICTRMFDLSGSVLNFKNPVTIAYPF